MLFYNALIFAHDGRYKGYLRTSDDGHIAEMGEGKPPETLMKGESMDCRGLWLLPGVIDSHVHFREPGGEHKADIASESRAAVAGGVTSYMEMPNTTPTTTTLEALEEKHRIASRSSLANYSFFIGATEGNIDVLRAVDYTHVPGIKLFMGSSTGGMLVEDEKNLRPIFRLRQLLMVHCEDEGIIRSNMQKVRKLCYSLPEIPVNWHPEVRNALACYSSTDEAIFLAKLNHTRLHIAHVSTMQELQLIASVPEDICQITAEVCLPHLLFSDEDYATLGTHIKCNPAVKSAPHRAALRAAVASGLITTVSTDHAPHTLAEKEHGGMLAPSGMPMVQFSLPAMLDMALAGLWSVDTVVETMCHAQAALFHVEGRGSLRPGNWADIVLVDPVGTTTINSSTILSKCGWSPLEGRKLATSVRQTYVNGTLVYDNQIGIIEPQGALPSRPLLFNRE